MAKNIIRVFWLIVVVGAITLFWWFFYGQGQNIEELMIHRDAAKFGLIPTVFLFVWITFFFITSIVTFTYFRKNIVQTTKNGE